mmetsp:Transcript_108340/g.349715  ORF Transcript_108340/g.349715 Transcript_108340/m.349715 type:complete len:217 (+) Transcript_108340:3-653(+)
MNGFEPSVTDGTAWRSHPVASAESSRAAHARGPFFARACPCPLARSLVFVGALQQVAHVQEAVEAALVEAQTPRRAFRRHRRRPGLVRDQSELAEVVTDAILHYLFPVLHRKSNTLLDDVELGAGLALAHHVLPVPEALRLQGVGELRALVGVHGAQQGHLGQEAVVAVTLLLSGLPHDVVEGVPVQLPTDAGPLALNGGGARAIVKQRELTEDVA